MSAATVLPSRPSMLDVPFGLHRDVPEEIYHEKILGLANKGALDQIARSPAHYMAWVHGKLSQEESPALRFGKALHCKILEPSKFARLYVVEPDFGDCRKTDNRKRRDDWRAEHAGALHLDAETMAALDGIAASIQAHPTASTLFTGGASEVTAKWTDPDTGIVCKCRGDFWDESIGTLVDLKSTEDARAPEFSRSVHRYRYHVQESFYRDGFALAGGSIEHFVFVAVEKKPPFAVAVYQLDDDAVLRGELDYRRDLRRMAECIERDAWPAYGDGITELSLPKYA